MVSAGDTVYVVKYDHRHGTDLYVFSSYEAATAKKEAIAKEWWGYEFPDVVPPADNIGDAYFDRMAEQDEWIDITQEEILA